MNIEDYGFCLFGVDDNKVYLPEVLSVNFLQEMDSFSYGFEIRHHSNFSLARVSVDDGFDYYCETPSNAEVQILIDSYDRGLSSIFVKDLSPDIKKNLFPFVLDIVKSSMLTCKNPFRYKAILESISKYKEYQCK